jgi:hypothetical protein
MARLIILTHMIDRGRIDDYLVARLFPYWLKAGHSVSIASGLDDLPAADAAIMHVDLTVVPGAYAAAAGRYPVVINGAVGDIRKRVVSRNLLRPGDAWTGTVIVKPDLNAGGLQEQRLHRGLGGPGSLGAPAPDLPPPGFSYALVRSVQEVPDRIWSDRSLVVERFLPERDGDDYCIRAWIFLGDRERCARFRSRSPVVKASGFIGREKADVPEALRAERARLGFDYGKFDFVIHDGMPVLLDANRTPGAPSDDAEIEAGNLDLARGIDMFLHRASR